MNDTLINYGICTKKKVIIAVFYGEERDISYFTCKNCQKGFRKDFFKETDISESLPDFIRKNLYLYKEEEEF